jgi:hypothetical protein
MKNTFIVKAGLFVLALPVFVLIQAPSSAAFTEVHEGDENAVGICADKTGAFPDLIFARLTTNVGGSVSGLEIHASYDDGNCTSVIYASSTEESNISSGLHQNRNDLVFALK